MIGDDVQNQSQESGTTSTMNRELAFAYTIIGIALCVCVLFVVGIIHG